MLGIRNARAPALSRALGTACGEALGLPGGPAGARFEAASRRALDAAVVAVTEARCAAVEAAAHGWVVAEESGRTHGARAVVIATGGLVGGGLAYAPGEAARATALPPAARPAIVLSVRAPLTVGMGGRPLDVPSSLFGLAPESISRPWVTHPLLERAGALLEGAPDGLLAAGEVAADVPRTWLASLADGVRAGLAAAEHARRYSIS
jgi:glycerol-3-phosphate dehydrogenase subunit B